MNRSAEDLQEHHATKAWLSLRPGQSPPLRIVELKPDHRKSGVYRLEGIGANGAAVVAKKCTLATVMVERTVYQQVLPQLPYPTLRFYGALEHPSREFGWLFIEDAGGAPYSLGDPEHRALAAEWLAILHTSSEGLRATVALPDRGLDYHLANLQAATVTLAASAGNPALTLNNLALLEAMLSTCWVIEMHWDLMHEVWTAMPVTMIHGGFYGKNVHIGERHDRQAVLAFDWESAGWGAPLLDLAREDLSAYWLRVRDHWPELGWVALEKGATVGRLLWAIKAIPGEAASLNIPWTHKVTQKMAYYRDTMQAAIERLGWES